MAAPLIFPKFRAFSANGAPLAGGKLYTYTAGTSSAYPTYTTATLAAANTNPVILDANGEAAVWPAPGYNYKLVLKDASDVTQWTVDSWSDGAYGATTSVTPYGENFVDMGASEGQIYSTQVRPGGTVGAAALCFQDRWWGYRGGQTGYSIGGSGAALPGRYSVSRDSGNANTTAIVLGQHMGRIGTTLDRLSNPGTAGLGSRYIVGSCYLLLQSGFTGTGITLELVGNNSDQNIMTGANWVVVSSITALTAELSSGSYTRIYCNLPNFGGYTYAGIRVRFNGPTGTAPASDGFYVTGLKVEVNTSGAPTDYAPMGLQQTIQRAQRYYQSYGGSTSGPVVQGYGAASQLIDTPLVLPVPMARSPATGVAGTWAVVNCAQPTVFAATPTILQLRTTVTALGAFSYAPNSADDLVTLDAETP